MYKGTFYDRNIKQKLEVNIRITDYGFEILNSGYITKINKADLYAIDQKDKHTLILKIGQDFPFSILEVSDPQFYEAIIRSYNHIKIKKDQAAKAYWFLFISLVLGLALLIVGAIYALPLIGEQIALQLPKQAEIKMGQASYASYGVSLKIDTARTKHANDIFKILNYGKEYPLEITVVSEPVKNAFALPGGHIVVYDGIIKEMGSAEEFAALIAHEAAHVNKRHATRTWGRMASTSMLMYWLFGDLEALAQISNEFVKASYSRDLESEADKVGVETLAQNSLDPQGMVRLLRSLEKEEKKEPYSMKYLRSHPMSVDRISVIDKYITTQKYEYSKNEKLQQLWSKLQMQEDTNSSDF